MMEQVLPESADQGWWEALQDTPFWEVWSGCLGAVALLAVLALAVGAFRLFRDSADLRAHRTEFKSLDDHKPLDLIFDPRGIVSRWHKILQTHARSGRPPDAGMLSELVRTRYAGIATTLPVLRSTAMLIGLLFTFLGLALVLRDLAEALNLEGALEVDAMAAAFGEVHDSLPLLGTAFMSSIGGVIVTILVGLAGALFGLALDRFEAGAILLSVESLEPRYSTKTDSRALEDAAEAIESGLSGLETTLVEHVAAASAQLDARFDELAGSHSQMVGLTQGAAEAAGRMTVLATALGRLPQELADTWARSMAETHEVHQKSVKAATEVVDGTARTLSEALTNAGNLVHRQLWAMADTTTRSTKAVTATMTAVREERIEAVAGLHAVSDGLVEGAKRFSELTGAASEALQVSAEHVDSLAEASRGFDQTLISVESILTNAARERDWQLAKIEEVFVPVTGMATAVNNASATTEVAARALASVLTSRPLRRYLDHMPDLARLAKLEIETHKQFQRSFAVVDKASVALGNLGATAERIDASAEDLRLSYVRLTDSLAELGNQVTPAVTDVLEATAQSAISLQEEQWQVRFSKAEARRAADLRQLIDLTAQLRRVADQLVEAQRAGYLARLLGLRK